MLKVYADETDWFIAESYDDLKKCIEEHHGSSYEDMVGESVENMFTVQSPSEMFQMHFPDDDLETAIRDSPESATEYHSNANTYPVMEATFGAWIAKRGRGFLASKAAEQRALDADRVLIRAALITAMNAAVMAWLAFGGA